MTPTPAAVRARIAILTGDALAYVRADAEVRRACRFDAAAYAADVEAAREAFGAPELGAWGRK